MPKQKGLTRHQVNPHAVHEFYAGRLVIEDTVGTVSSESYERANRGADGTGGHSDACTRSDRTDGSDTCRCNGSITHRGARNRRATCLDTFLDRLTGLSLS